MSCIAFDAINEQVSNGLESISGTLSENISWHISVL